MLTASALPTEARDRGGGQSSVVKDARHEGPRDADFFELGKIVLTAHAPGGEDLTLPRLPNEPAQSCEIGATAGPDAVKCHQNDASRPSIDAALHIRWAEKQLTAEVEREDEARLPEGLARCHQIVRCAEALGSEHRNEPRWKRGAGGGWRRKAAVEPEFDIVRLFRQMLEDGVVIAFSSNGIKVSDVDDRKWRRGSKTSKDVPRVAARRKRRDDRSVIRAIPGTCSHDFAMLQIENWYDGK